MERYSKTFMASEYYGVLGSVSFSWLLIGGSAGPIAGWFHVMVWIRNVCGVSTFFHNSCRAIKEKEEPTLFPNIQPHALHLLWKNTCGLNSKRSSKIVPPSPFRRKRLPAGEWRNSGGVYTNLAKCFKLTAFVAVLEFWLSGSNVLRRWMAVKTSVALGIQLLTRSCTELCSQ